jgi:hypothetical protein
MRQVHGKSGPLVLRSGGRGQSFPRARAGKQGVASTWTGERRLNRRFEERLGAAARSGWPHQVEGVSDARFKQRGDVTAGGELCSVGPAENNPSGLGLARLVLPSAPPPLGHAAC